MRCVAVPLGEVDLVEGNFVFPVSAVDVVVVPRRWALRFAGVVDRADTYVAEWASPACVAKSHMEHAVLFLTGARAENARSLIAFVVCATGFFLADARCIDMESGSGWTFEVGCAWPELERAGDGLVG